MSEANQAHHVPRLNFGDEFDIADGVTVWPIAFPHDLAHPPFESTVFIIEPGKCSPPDSHAVEETWVILKGAGRLDYDGQSMRLSGGDKVFFPSHRTHQVTNDADGPLEILSIYWEPHAQNA
ncbi:cupin domain-containing protein [Trinickia fusca]|uniref:Cupin domain-containing protein n=1 Tax=Trinickia fusca TaxID=2419777 RepID=A0A494X4I8_9BURK|nr:cupin domain-containing protein [Trinickia fusca]RKP45262.1 cupin domain-containing protein [Trinickia fusca]